MATFNGFNTPNGKTVPLPAAFFTDLLPQINTLAELKVVLWAFHCLNLQQGDLRYLRDEDFTQAQSLVKSLGFTDKEAIDALEKALESALQHGALLKADCNGERLFFLNSPKGKAALDGLLAHAWSPDSHPVETIAPGRPNIFTLYEQNIGPLTPLLAEELRDAESEFPEDWIKEALRIAVNQNARSWHYVSAILRRWKEKGRDEGNQRTTQENRKLDSEGQYGDFIHH